MRHVRWRAALVLWLVAGVCFVVAPAWAVPVSVDGMNISMGQLFLLLGLAMAWGDTRRKVEDLRDDMKHLPCRKNGCDEK
jgi:uncharacterized membrane protein YfcA